MRALAGAGLCLYNGGKCESFFREAFMQSIVWSVRRRERPSERVLSILMSVLAVFFLLQGILFSRAFMLPCVCMAACRFVYGAARVRDYECTLEDGKLTIARVSDRGRQRLHEIPLADFEILSLPDGEAVLPYKKGGIRLPKYDYTSYREDVPWYTLITQENGQRIKLLCEFPPEALEMIRRKKPGCVRLA